MTQKVLLISVRPQHAVKIFDGTKTFELRRRRPKVEPGDWILVYVSSPVKALIGAFEVGQIREGIPRTMWRYVQEKAGVTKAEFDQYYEGAERAIGIGVLEIKKLEIPIGLGCMRQRIADFNPPQEYRYLTHDQLQSLEVKGLIEINGACPVRRRKALKA